MYVHNIFVQILNNGKLYPRASDGTHL